MRKSAFVSAVGRIALALVAAVGFTTAVAPATPAAAACSSVVFAQYIELSTKGFKLVQDSGCTERWGQLVVDSTYPTGPAYSIKYERQIQSPYGYYTERVSTATMGSGGTGVRTTARGANTSGESDRHRVCWGSGYWNGSAWVPDGNWTCGAWYF